MKFYNDFIGEDIINTKVNFLHGNSDSEESGNEVLATHYKE